MSELSVIRHLLNKTTYHGIRDRIDVEDLSKDLHPILRTIDAHFLGDNHESITVDDLSNLYFSTNRGKIEFYQDVFEAIRKNEASLESTEKLIDGLQTSRLLRELSLDAYDAAEGRKPMEGILAKLEALKQTGEGDASKDSDLDDFVSDDLIEIVNASRAVEGLRWRLNSLNQALGSLRQGNFGFVFARPETGKTTFLASEVTHMASQAKGPILWFNNEQVGREVMLRCYQAALGIDMVTLLRDMPGNHRRYHEITHGNIKLKDSASIHWRQVEKICSIQKPSLVVFDQIDKIKGFDSDREDLRLGAIYIWARELAKTYCPVVGVCQSDGSGEGQKWLTMGNVANAKTSKQAEADWILGIGKVNEPGYDNLRFMHLSKNKLVGDPDGKPEMRHGRFETLIDPTIARYQDLM